MDSCELESAKTKALESSLRKIIQNDLALVIDGNERNGNFELASRNIQRISYLPQLVGAESGNELQGANVYDILKRKYLILSLDAVKCLTERLTDE